MLGRDRLQYKTPDQVRLMRRAGLVVADALDAVRGALRTGVTTGELDKIAEDVIRSAGATPSFFGYAQPPYPASTCISVNDEVVHGIPGPRVIAAGDVVSVDCGAIVEGWHGDAAFSAVLPREDGTVVAADAALCAAAEQALWAGIAAFATGERLVDIGAAVEDSVGKRYGLVEDYGGHGIGTAMHMDPHVLNYRTRDKGPRLRAGLCLAIEPMLTAGHPDTKVAADEWTVLTQDGGRAAHWEHSSARLESGVWVLTARDGGQAALGALGVPVTPLGD
jgi:methionyl aminopeptidase